MRQNQSTDATENKISIPIPKSESHSFLGFHQDRYEYEPDDVFSLLIPDPDDRQSVNRINRYVNWLKETGYSHLKPDLSKYRDYLFSEGMKDTSIKVYLSEVRKGYELLLDNRNYWFKIAGILSQNKSDIEIKMIADELIERVRIAVNPKTHKVKVVKKQDMIDDEHFRLTPYQVRELLSLPDRNTIYGIRDSAIIALFLSTGIREHELVSTQKKDIYQTANGEKVFHVKLGKGRKSRIIPYGSLWNMLEGYLDDWFNHRICEPDDYVFTRFYKGGKVSSDPLTTYSIQWLLRQYPVMNNGELKHVRPHDLRRTYARTCYNNGMGLYDIQQNMGHTSETTTKRYIGILNVGQRRPPDNMYGIESPAQNNKKGVNNDYEGRKSDNSHT